MKAVKIIVTGLVQGVGFRPFVERAVRKRGLVGYVRNVGGSEVEIWVEGPVDEVESFLLDLFLDKPKVAVIDEIYMEEVEPAGYSEFKILPSLREKNAASNIPPDFAICEDCVREILDPANGRYRYPFNSCAWCGPRYSMMYTTPYDRENTSMRDFPLCEECLREYRDPDNERRHHAQGISCPRDGPVVRLVDKNFTPVSTSDPIKEAAKLIDEGYIVGVKGIGGYHIASLATDDEVVLKLRERKKRPRKPFAIMGLDVDVLRRLVYMDERDEELLKSPAAPILILPKREESPVSKHVSPGLKHEGVFVAYSGLHYLLLMETRDKFLIMTSGNISGEPMCVDEECAKTKLSRIVDYFLIHNRRIVNRVDDSVLRKTGGEYVFLRRSRGYAPYWIRINKFLHRPVLAFGADLNNAGALAFEDKVVLTPYIGDLDSARAQADLQNTLLKLANDFRVDLSDAIVVVDKHPEYYSRKIGLSIAEKLGLEVVESQHHYSHLLSVFLDRGLPEEFGGLAVDGTGYGDDGTIWGGEVINIHRSGYTRRGHIQQIPVTSERDIYLPIRLTSTYLAMRGYTLEETLSELKVTELRLKREIEAAYSLFKSGRYVMASSMGRLLDMLYSILYPSAVRSFEGELAIRLEELAHGTKPDLLDERGRIVQENTLYVYDYWELVEHVLEKRVNADKSQLASSILYTIGYMLGELFLRASRPLKHEKMAFSGGAAVNEYIYNGLRDRLAEEDVKLYLPLRIPPNDGGIAMGQVGAVIMLVNNLEH